ncbi:hypothetical protein AF335_30655 [Streptomyces eurocidicus]|uniref:Uncharacterized protein n=1 Tax=Streptomyces eurocidicus TaxID=66423 RepID=A0A2N8NMY9_STREU|nr:hypothetical protein AF335_30655 [Streptomyces eurocidicus]
MTKSSGLLISDGAWPTTGHAPGTDRTGDGTGRGEGTDSDPGGGAPAGPPDLPLSGPVPRADSRPVRVSGSRPAPLKSPLAFPS